MKLCNLRKKHQTLACQVMTTHIRIDVPKRLQKTLQVVLRSSIILNAKFKQYGKGYTWYTCSLILDHSLTLM